MIVEIAKNTTNGNTHEAMKIFCWMASDNGYTHDDDASEILAIKAGASENKRMKRMYREARKIYCMRIFSQDSPDVDWRVPTKISEAVGPSLLGILAAKPPLGKGTQAKSCIKPPVTKWPGFPRLQGTVRDASQVPRPSSQFPASQQMTPGFPKVPPPPGT